MKYMSDFIIYLYIMDKLLKLLNEYDGDVLEYWFVDGCIRRKVKNFNNEKNTWKSVVWYTKEFWFIQRLVDNDKIDLDEFSTIDWFDDYESLLMRLAIDDEPISFLISILK